MQNKEIENLLKAQLCVSTIEVRNEGNHFDILLVSDDFEELSRVKRQQLVYAVLNEKIISGEMHAVNMRLFSNAEYVAQ